MSIALAILAFGALIAFHEFGHMWVARRMGMRVERFSIGFGPAVYSWRRGETEYVLSALPFGGYVKIAGMLPEDGIAEDETTRQDPQSYANKPAWRRFLVIAAGPFANYLLAFLIGVPLLLAGTMVADPSSRLGEVMPGSPAAHAGLKPDDELLRVGDVPVSRFQEVPAALVTATAGVEGTEVPFLVRRGSNEITVLVTPEKNGEAMFLGVAQALSPQASMGVLAAIPQALRNIHNQNVATISSVSKMISRTQKVALSGPIGILSQTAEQAERGALHFFITVWSITIAIAFFNLLPIPGLDGGRLIFLIYEIIARRQINQKVEGWIHAVGILALLALILFVSYGDIMKKFGS